MNSKEFKKALDYIVTEKGIEEEVVIEAMQAALSTAFRKNEKADYASRVLIDKNTGEIKVFKVTTIVDDYDEELENETLELEEGEEERLCHDYLNEIMISDAKKINKEYQVGDEILEEVTPKDFGRVAISVAKQVVLQKIREAEREKVMDEFEDKEEELMVGFLAMEDARNYYVDLGKARGILPKTELIPNEKLTMGDSIKVYITKIESTPKGPLILVSRKNYGFVKRLFEHEIPEFSDGTLELRGVAREPGIRSKVAVLSTNPKVDPVGSCIGEKGRRIANIISELGGEKIDLIAYSDDPETFVANALSPAKNLNVSITDEKKKEVLVIADDENLSLAIGKKGINIKLASKLTKYTINIKTLADINAQINS
ncbi:MAG: transcription termination/antitermination protein NusA [Tenericutes bacterium]|nr:transcription termination/antitermination protein NusA [Mycoplasmatota bacterium]